MKKIKWPWEIEKRIMWHGKKKLKTKIKKSYGKSKVVRAELASSAYGGRLFVFSTYPFASFDPRLVLRDIVAAALRWLPGSTLSITIVLPKLPLPESRVRLHFQSLSSCFYNCLIAFLILLRTRRFASLRCSFPGNSSYQHHISVYHTISCGAGGDL